MQKPHNNKNGDIDVHESNKYYTNNTKKLINFKVWDKINMKICAKKRIFLNVIIIRVNTNDL